MNRHLKKPMEPDLGLGNLAKSVTLIKTMKKENVQMMSVTLLLSLASAQRINMAT